MAVALDVQPILAEAEKKETEYDWLAAAKLYERALGRVSEEAFEKRAEIFQRCGYSLYKSAMQADNITEFRERIGQAIREYKKGSELYDRLIEERRETKKSTLPSYGVLSALLACI